jgi:hypothetical protein
MSKWIVLDANILLRGILGERVPQLIAKYSGQVQFFTCSLARCFGSDKAQPKRLFRRL